jgi:hypothetical protein
MRDRYKILAAKEMQRGKPKKGMVQIAAFRYETDAVSYFEKTTTTSMRDWYLQLIDKREKTIMLINEPVVEITGHLANE